MSPQTKVWILVTLFAIACAARFVWWLVDSSYREFGPTWEYEQWKAWHPPLSFGEWVRKLFKK